MEQQTQFPEELNAKIRQFVVEVGGSLDKNPQRRQTQFNHLLTQFFQQLNESNPTSRRRLDDLTIGEVQGMIALCVAAYQLELSPAEWTCMEQMILAMKMADTKQAARICIHCGKPADTFGPFEEPLCQNCYASTYLQRRADLSDESS